jgi:ionotropic glutamate receptor
MFLSQDSGDINCDCANATVFFAKPTPNETFTARYKELTEKYKLKGQPAISAAFYFDVVLRTFLATK